MSRESGTSAGKGPKGSGSLGKNPPGEGGENPDGGEPGEPFTPGPKVPIQVDGVEPLPPTPLEPKEGIPTPGSATSGPLVRVPSEEPRDRTKKKKSPTKMPKKGGGGTPRGGHTGSKSHRGEMKFGEKPNRPSTTLQTDTGSMMHETGEDDDGHFDPSKFQRMTAVYFHKYNDLSRSARGVGYTPNQAVPHYGPGVTDEAEKIYGPCKLLTDFQYSTWTETVVPLRNHNVVQGFNEMILFLIKLAANPDGPVNHEEAFMAASFLANIRNDLGEHPPNVLALLEHIDYMTLDDGTEPANPEMEVITPCQASERY